jgi:hypothetical protein
MANINGIPIDEGLSDILAKLKQSNITANKEKKSQEVQNQKIKSEKPSLLNQYYSHVQSVNKSVQTRAFAKQEYKELEAIGFTDEDILPWFSYSDLDKTNFYYVKTNGELCVTKTNSASIETIKSSKDYLCSVDYFKSQHYVLHVRQLESDYSYSRVYTNESLENDIIIEEVINVEDSQPTLIKASTEEIISNVSDSYKYYHFVVFTDLGIADFIAKSDDVSYPYHEDNLSKWFENVSNTAILKCANFDYNKHYNLQDSLDKLQPYNYDLISAVRPGIFVVNSSENTDSVYKVIIKLKNEFSFLSTTEVLKCFKFYANSNKKSFGEFKQFLNMYFEVIIK